MNLKVFNLVSGVDETKFVVQHESRECKCRLNESVCNSKQKWNHVDCQYQCKELDDWGSCKNGYIWHFSTCDCECNKVCQIDKHWDIRNCSCKTRLIGKLVLQRENEILNTTETLVDDEKVVCTKGNCLTHAISLVLILLLLLSVTFVILNIDQTFYYHFKTPVLS